MIEIVFVVVIIGWVLWTVFFSPQARDTRELAYLNRIWEEYNNRFEKRKDFTDLENILIQHNWKFHRDKVKMLLDMMVLIKPNYIPKQEAGLAYCTKCELEVEPVLKCKCDFRNK